MKFKKIIAVALSGVFCINLALTSTAQAAQQKVDVPTQTAQTDTSSVSNEEITAEEKQVVKEIQTEIDKSSETKQTKAAKVLNKIKKNLLSKPSRIIIKSVLSIINVIIVTHLLVDFFNPYISFLALEAATNAIDLYLIEKIA